MPIYNNYPNESSLNLKFKPEISYEDKILSFQNSLSYKGSLCPSNVAQWNDFYKISKSNCLLPQDQTLHFIKNIESNQDLAQNIEKVLINKIRGLEYLNPVLFLSIEGMDSQSKLDKEDLAILFVVFGEIEENGIEIIQHTKAIVKFKHLINAYIARHQLNGKYIRNINATVLLDWYKGPNQLLESHVAETKNDESKSIVFEAEESSYKEINKYVCRYDILLDKIDYNKDFEIAKKIIGPNGRNMKEIVDKCTKLERQSELESSYNYRPKRNGDRDKEAVKLRLRGKYSGYKEQKKQEIGEGLHLCISSKYCETFYEACRLIELLLNSIVTEYKKYANKNKLKDRLIQYKKHDLTSNLNEEGLVKEKSNSSKESKSANERDMNASTDKNIKDESETFKSTNNSVLINKLHGDGIICKNITFSSLTKFKEYILELDRRLDTSEIISCIEIRNNARKNCNFALADEYREALRQSGVAVMDEKGGRGRGSEVTTWKYWKPYNSNHNY
eukprot:Mrub_02763.p1 GENE.Mrub_02763~~Mrub_02763.p1  ORF type:complete len:515 (-),score=89.15 Mrub_02763:77-1588(-)